MFNIGSYGGQSRCTCTDPFQDLQHLDPAPKYQTLQSQNLDLTQGLLTSTHWATDMLGLFEHADC